jgi:peptidoglycan DL-endopeptidase RipA
VPHLHRAGTAAVLVAVLTAVLALAGPGSALAAPPPTPPPNPSDQQLQQSRDAVAQQAGVVGQLTGQLAALDAEAEDLRVQLADRQDQAQGALVDLQNAQDAAAAAAAEADAARVATRAASTAIDDAQKRLDDFLTGTYQQGLDAGPLGLLSSATTPDELVARAQFQDLIATQQKSAVDGLEKARAEKANADSAARAALDDARDKQAAATRAKGAADTAVASAQSAAQEQAKRLAAVAVQKQQVAARLDALAASDAGLRAQRDRFRAWQAEQARIKAEQERAAAAAAAARVTQTSGAPVRVGGGVQRVIDRAMAQLGVQYAWGGGNGRGPTRGIRDGGVADSFGDFRRIGFDCSGLMIYAFAGVGVSLPHYSGYQYTSGDQVPVSQRRPGDMLFYAHGGGVIGHVALYVGNGRMIEAPYSGAAVRLVPMRFGGLMPYATRML